MPGFDRAWWWMEDPKKRQLQRMNLDHPDLIVKTSKGKIFNEQAIMWEILRRHPDLGELCPRPQHEWPDFAFEQCLSGDLFGLLLESAQFNWLQFKSKEISKEWPNALNAYLRNPDLNFSIKRSTPPDPLIDLSAAARHNARRVHEIISGPQGTVSAEHPLAKNFKVDPSGAIRWKTTEVTETPGAVNAELGKLINRYRLKGMKIMVLAVDPEVKRIDDLEKRFGELYRTQFASGSRSLQDPDVLRTIWNFERSEQSDPAPYRKLFQNYALIPPKA